MKIILFSIPLIIFDNIFGILHIDKKKSACIIDKKTMQSFLFFKLTA